MFFHPVINRVFLRSSKECLFSHCKSGSTKELRCLYGIVQPHYYFQPKSFTSRFHFETKWTPAITSSNRFIHGDTKKRSSDFLLDKLPSEPFSEKFVNACPENLRPYLKLMRIDRPIGTWLIFLPCAWSISLATPAGQLPDPKMLLLFGMGSFLMRGAGCIINDMWDKDFDSKVARTRDRPLACGDVTRFKALCFLSVPLTMSLSILLTFNWNTILLGICSMAPCILYPLAKRFTYWPQAFLGLTFNWGVVMGWTAACNSLDWVVASLYLSSIAWTLLYDTVYAFQDINDDLMIGVKSTAIKFGENTKYWLTGFGACVIGGLATTGYLCDQTWIYYGGVMAFAAHLAHQVWSVNLSDGRQCGEKFRSNRNLGLLFWALIVLSNLVKKENDDDNNKEQSEERLVRK